MPGRDDLTEEEVQEETATSVDGNEFTYDIEEIDMENMEFKNATNALNLGLDHVSQSGLETGDPYGNSGLKILGMPMFYSPLDDPLNRTYRNTFETDLPLVFIHPGTPKINGKLFCSGAE